MKHLLILAQPRDPITGLRVDVRLGSGMNALANGLGGQTWEAAVHRRPTIMFDLMSPDLDGAIQAARANLTVDLNRILNVPNVRRFDWAGAPITIYDATGLDAANLPIEFKGVVRLPQLDLFEQKVALDLIVDRSRLDRPLLTAEFDGSGGAGGDAGKRGTLKPAGFGVCLNVEPVWFDETRNIGMLDGYGNLSSVQAVFEGGADLGPSVGNYVTYAALAAALDSKAIPDGRWGTCYAEGLIGMGAPPAGVIGVHCTFTALGVEQRRSGTFINLVLSRAGVAAGDIFLASFTSLDTAVPRNIHYWTKDQRQVLDLAQAIAGAANATLLIQPDGRIAVTRAFGGTNIGTVNKNGTSTPPWTDWRVADPVEPTWRMRARAARPARVLEYQEVFYEDNLEDRGAYKTTETYRQGNLVWAPNGAQFLYINATPAANQPLPVAPDTSNAHWQQTRGPTTAADLVYADGTSIENLKPGELGSNKTETRTAAAIASQGAFATLNSAAYGSSLLTGFGTLAPRSDVRIGSELVRADGTTATTEASLITSLGTAAGIANQGALATLSNLAYGTPQLTGFGAMAARQNVRVGFELVLANGTTVATESTVVTVQGTAAGISGQGALATKSAVDLATAEVTNKSLSNVDTAAAIKLASMAAGSGVAVELTAIGTVPPTIIGNQYRKSGFDDHNSAVVGPPIKGPSVVSQLVGPGYTIICLDDDATTTAYGAQTFEAQCWNGNQGALIVNGNQVFFGAIGFSPKRIALVYDDAHVRFFADATQIGAAQIVGSGLTFYPKGKAYTGGNNLLGPLLAGPAPMRPDINSNVIDGGASYGLVPRSDLRTSLGTAAAIASQGALATLNSLAYGSPQLTGLGSLAARTTVRVGYELVLSDGSTVAVETTIVTSQGTAAAIANQGSLATRNDVATGHIQAQAVTVPYVLEGADVFVSSDSETTILETGWLTIGDATSGGAFIMIFGEMDSGSQKDSAQQVTVYTDTGGGYVPQTTVRAGARGTSGDVYAKIPVSAAFAVTGQNLRVALTTRRLQMPGAGNAFSSNLRSPTIVIMAGKR